MQLSFLVAKALLEGDFASYFASLPSADDEPEPIVLREGKFERVSPHGARGARDRGGGRARRFAKSRPRPRPTRLLVRNGIRAYGWEPVAENGSCRIVGLDTTAPSFKEIDGSGRFVWAFDVLLTVVRGI